MISVFVVGIGVVAVIVAVYVALSREFARMWLAFSSRDVAQEEVWKERWKLVHDVMLNVSQKSDELVVARTQVLVEALDMLSTAEKQRAETAADRHPALMDALAAVLRGQRAADSAAGRREKALFDHIDGVCSLVSGNHQDLLKVLAAASRDRDAYNDRSAERFETVLGVLAGLSQSGVAKHEDLRAQAERHFEWISKRGAEFERGLVGRLDRMVAEAEDASAALRSERDEVAGIRDEQASLRVLVAELMERQNEALGAVEDNSETLVERLRQQLDTERRAIEGVVRAFLEEPVVQTQSTPAPPFVEFGKVSPLAPPVGPRVPSGGVMPAIRPEVTASAPAAPVPSLMPRRSGREVAALVHDRGEGRPFTDADFDALLEAEPDPAVPAAPSPAAAGLPLALQSKPGSRLGSRRAAEPEAAAVGPGYKTHATREHEWSPDTVERGMAHLRAQYAAAGHTIDDEQLRKQVLDHLHDVEE